MFEFGTKQRKSVHPWIEATTFENLSQRDVLKKILDRVRESCRNRVQSGGLPISVVFDLDSTIFDVKPRTLKIMKEFVHSPEASGFSTKLKDWAMSLKSHDLSYTIRDTAMANAYPIGEERAEDFLKTMGAFWKDRFFTDPYLYLDHPSPGAQEFVHLALDAGAHAIYLTGRDDPGMGRGTRSALTHWGFPMESHRTKLVMKPSFGTDDAEFKDQALRDLRSHYEAVALIDNEPANFYAFEKNFPTALLVFIHTNCSNKEARKIQSIFKIENFLFR